MRNKRHKRKTNSSRTDGLADDGEDEYYKRKKYVGGEELNNGRIQI